MLVIHENQPLAPRTTLGLGGPARRYIHAGNRPTLEAAFRCAASDHDRVLILGGGSNLVVADAGFDGLVIEPDFRGLEIVDDGDDHALVHAGGGEPWDPFVATVCAAGLAGLECLSGIPGRVGATPMQNVGAYGQEVSDTIVELEAYEPTLNQYVTIAGRDCDFAYRSSRFRGSDRFVILRVTFRLSRSPLGLPVKYAELAKALGLAAGQRAPLAQIRDTVIALRRGKGMVFDATDPESRSVGSFFTNPIVDADTFAQLALPEAPHWVQPDGRIKLSAGWLIERAGFLKGHRVGDVGISTKHALALVNRGGTTCDLLALAGTIQDTVRTRLGVSLHPEPIIV